MVCFEYQNLQHVYEIRVNLCEKIFKNRSQETARHSSFRDVFKNSIIFITLGVTSSSNVANEMNHTVVGKSGKQTHKSPLHNFTHIKHSHVFSHIFFAMFKGLLIQKHSHVF